MKKILFVIPAFSIGGTNTSLISLLPFIDRSRFDVYVYALNPTGPLGKEVSKYSTVLNPQQIVSASSNQSRNYKSILKDVLRVVKQLMGRIGINVTPLYYKRQVKALSNKRFDCVIAFQEGEATHFVQYFRNTRKAAWVRANYARYLSITKLKPEVKLYNHYDVIVNVSNSALRGFVSVLPQYKEKSIYIYNLVNRERIISMSKQIDVNLLKRDVFTIVSLGRIDKVKHFTEIPDICKKLREEDISFCWLIIGGPTVRYPEEYDSLKNKIREYALSDNVILVGHQSNPYPILASSDLLVCLSESETFNHTFAEARTLGVPVLSVNYPGADEILGKNRGGILTTRDNVGDVIKNIISDKAKYSELKEQAVNFSFDNNGQLTKLYDLVFAGDS